MVLVAHGLAAVAHFTRTVHGHEDLGVAHFDVRRAVRLAQHAHTALHATQLVWAAAVQAQAFRGHVLDLCLCHCQGNSLVTCSLPE